MDTLLQVGLVEALTAALIVGFCVLINWLTRPRRRTERELTRLLAQIAEPERTPPPAMVYRGVAYQPLPSLSLATEDASAQRRPTPSGPTLSADTFSPLPASVSMPQPVVRLTYRGITYTLDT